MSQAEQTGTWGRFKAFKERHHVALDVIFFFGGFMFDLLLLERIDSWPMLIHQGSYLLLTALLIGVDHRIAVRGSEPKGFFGKVLGFRQWVIHFFLGTLLNAFVVFYFRAASTFFGWQLVFVAAIVAVLVANELPRFRRFGPVMRVALLSFAVTSYFIYLLPVVAGFLSAWLFLAAVAVGTLLTLGLWKAYARLSADPAWTFQRGVLPGLLVQVLLVVFYFAHLIPPVPLSLKWIGVYHDVQRVGSEVKLSYLEQGWHFWAHGDALFKARPGDRVYLFTRIFAPRNFRDRLFVRWAYLDGRNQQWVRTDAIPLTISGGTEEGWRGVAYKQNYQPGEWRVNVETDDGRDIGYIRFTLVDDDSTEPRTFLEDVR